MYQSQQKVVKCDVKSVNQEVMTSQKLNLSNYGIGWQVQKEEDEICSPAKNEPVCANWRGEISTIMFR